MQLHARFLPEEAGWLPAETRWVGGSQIMTLTTIQSAPNGDTWIQVGYSSPRVRTSGATYRYIRLRDGARIRVPSSRFYECVISRRNWREWTAVDTGYDESASGGGAAKLANDVARAHEIDERSRAGTS